jgi:AcrR family transcriptional regulator
VAKIERRERERAEFREEVLAAAKAIVLEGGYDALTMRKIADAIEYAPGTIYLYFESRDAIALELCEQGFQEFLAALAPAAEVKDPFERIVDLGRRYVRFGMEHPETYRLIFMEDPKFFEAIFEQRAEQPDSPGMRALQLLIDTFEVLKKQKRLAADASPRVLAEMIWAAVHGIVSLKITYHRLPETSAEDLLEAMTRALFGGLLRN